MASQPKWHWVFGSSVRGDGNGRRRRNAWIGMPAQRTEKPGCDRVDVHMEALWLA